MLRLKGLGPQHFSRSAAQLFCLFAWVILCFAQPSAPQPAPPPAGTHATNKVNQAPLTDINLGTGFGGLTFTMALHVEHPFVFFDNTQQGNNRFSGITVDLAKRLCEILQCNLDFMIASEANPESSEAALLAVGTRQLRASAAQFSAPHALSFRTRQLPRSTDRIWPHQLRNRFFPAVNPIALGAGMPVGSPHIADIAAGAIHITPNRSSYVHFTLPYFDAGFVTVVATPQGKAYNIMAFLDPFQGNLWACLIIEMMLMGLVFCVIEAPWLSVAEESDVVDGHLSSIFDCIYWSISALTCTLDKGPKTWGGKLAMLAHGWFMLIIISSYTANLATFLTTSSLTPSITGWPDVTSGGTQIKIAIPAGLSHDDFLKFEKGHYNYQFNVAVTTTTWEESIKAVEQGAADVTFHDQPMVQYYMLNEMDTSSGSCPAMMVGKTFAPAGYGFAFGVDSTAFLPWSQAILTLKENGEITKLVESYGVGSAKAEADIAALCGITVASASMDFKEFHGLFIMTGVITGVGLIVHAIQKVLQGNVESGSNKVESVETIAIGDPAVDAALKAGVEAALKESLDIAFKAGMEAGVKVVMKQLPAAQAQSGTSSLHQ